MKSMVFMLIIILSSYAHASDGMECCISKTDAKFTYAGSNGFLVEWSCTPGRDKAQFESGGVFVVFRLGGKKLVFKSPAFQEIKTEKKLCKPEDSRRIVLSDGSDPLDGLMTTYLQTSIFFPYSSDGIRLSLNTFHDKGEISLYAAKKPKVVNAEVSEEQRTSRKSSQTNSEQKVIDGPSGKTVVTTKSTTVINESVTTTTKRSTKKVTR